jgi:hypothetical protein
MKYRKKINKLLKRQKGYNDMTCDKKSFTKPGSLSGRKL